MSLGLQTAGLMDKVTGKASAWFQGWLQKVDNALIITGTLTSGNIIVSSGGNDVADGGAVPTGTVTHTGGLTDHAVIVGNGVADISALASLGTTTTVLHGNAAADPAFSAVVEADITLANNTTNNVSTTKHGFAPILPNDATKFLNGTGGYTVPTGSGTGTVTNTGTLTANKAIIGNGGVDVTVSALTGIIKQASGTQSVATAGTDYVVPGSLTGANVATDESTATTSYTDLATSGPAVTITTVGTTAVVWLSATLYRIAAAGNSGFISVAVSGATTVAASDANGSQISSYVAAYALANSRVVILTGLTPGANTFTMKYRVDGGTFNFFNRSIAVFAP